MISSAIVAALFVAAVDATPGSDLLTPAPAGFAFEVHALGQLAYSAIQRDPTVDFVGTTNGFRLLAARVELDASEGNSFRFRFSLDGAHDSQPDPNSFLGHKTVTLADAFAEVGSAAFYLRAGQFKAPFNEEALLSDASLKFTVRSVATRGVVLDEGFAEPGLSLDRQLGAAVGASHEFGGVRGWAEASVFNGNGTHALVNSNRALAGAARVALSTSRATVSLSGFGQKLTTLDRLDLRLDEIRFGGAAALLFEMDDVHLFAQIVGRSVRAATVAENNSSPESVPPTSLGGGASLEVAYLIRSVHLEPALRAEVFRPDSLRQERDLLFETIGLNYVPDDLPVKIMADVILKQQPAARRLTNNQVMILAQASF